MFEKYFQLEYQVKLPKELQIISSAASTSENTVVLWGKIEERNQLITYDRINDEWRMTVQTFESNIFKQPQKIAINEVGNTLITCSTDRLEFCYWLRIHINSRWILKKKYLFPVINQYTMKELQYYFYGDKLFLAHLELLQINDTFTQNFKNYRKYKIFYNDYLTCIQPDYEQKALVQVTDGIIYIWKYQNGGLWRRMKKILYDGEEMPNYAFIAENQCTIIINERAFIVKMNSDFEDDIKDIIDPELKYNSLTAGGKNYFCQIINENQLIYWYQTKNANSQFEKETFNNMNLKDILAVPTGQLFVCQVKNKNIVKLQIYKHRDE